MPDAAGGLRVLQAHVAADCPDRESCWAKDIHDEHDPRTGYQPATERANCPRCNAHATTDRHYPSGYGDHPEPVNRYYCCLCDIEWWVKP